MGLAWLGLAVLFFFLLLALGSFSASAFAFWQLYSYRWSGFFRYCFCYAFFSHCLFVFPSSRFCGCSCFLLFVFDGCGGDKNCRACPMARCCFLFLLLVLLGCWVLQQVAGLRCSLAAFINTGEKGFIHLRLFVPSHLIQLYDSPLFPPIFLLVCRSVPG
ncbi:hypothetical protein L228DRAFT_139820 [Xylona heveae TC161]|uniref:Uncharacterized protein n=1 Tax=Xylona heveae (strain CBS 132557 / TC161) TaxID=1328760 RepID=A0A165H3J9_XYLHT|nr:hypothetical protein L228DRAFT_139820 [Xylona heveae TC161]KZF22935.1 hypothetical protein L228DRAFT_139820 [Xylona heveae TC161]